VKKHEMLTIHSADDTDMAGHLRGAANFEKLASNCHIRIGIKPNLTMAAADGGGAANHP
jgi:hypothetical protein